MAEPAIPNPHDRFFREAFTRNEVARGFSREYLPPTLVRRLNLDTRAIALCQHKILIYLSIGLPMLNALTL